MPRRRKKVYPVNQETVSNTAHQQRLLIAEKLKKLEQEKSASVKHGNKGKHKKKCHDTKFKRPKYDNKTEKETRKNSVEESWAKGNADEDSEKVSVAKVDIDAESDKETDVKENQVKDSKVHSVTIINPNNDDDVECEANDDVVADSDVESDIKDTPNEDSDVDRETIHPPYRDSDVECEANDNVVAESDVESDIEDKPVEDSDVDSDTIHPPYRDSDVDSKVNDNLVEDRDDTENQIEDIDVDSNANDTSNKDSDKVSEAKVNVDKDGDIEFEAKKHTDEDCEVENETKEKPLDDKEPNRSKNKGTKHYTHMYRRNKRDWSHSEQSMTGEEESKDLSDNDFENKNEKQWSQMESGWGENGVSYPKEMSYEGNSDTNYKTYSYESHDDDDDETRWERNTFTNRDFSNFNLGNEKSGTEKEDRTKTRKNSDQFQEMLSDDDSDLKSGNVEKCEIESESQTNSTSSESDHKAQSVRTEFGRTFNITIEQDEWNTVKPTKFEKIMKPNWTNIFANAFNKKVPGCVLKFHYHKVNGNLKRAGSYFNAKASCKHPGCGIFMLKINAKPRKAEKKVMVDVHAIEPIVKHTPELIKKRKLAMTNRQKAKQKLMHQTASTIHYSEFGKMTNEEIKEGNYTKCQSEEVLRKAKSEWNLHEALHQDPFTELVISQEIYREEDEDSKHTIGYIQEISYQPFMVITYMEQSIQAAKYNIKYGNGVFHLDATGTVVKKIHPDRKVLYYSLIMHTDGVIVPVLEYLTDHQGTHYISRPLLNFQGLLGQRYRPKRIEVDFSWALIHSVLLSFNCLKINEYLELCFELDEEQMKNGITVVHVCCVHMLRAVREHLKDKVKDKAMRELLLRLWAVLQNTKTLNGARKVWKIMCLVFARKYEGRRVENAIAAMNEMVMTASFDELDGNFCMEDDQSTHISTHDQAQKTGIRALSPYKKFFLVPDEEADEDRPVNTYYNRDVMEYLSNNYMPLYPLWSGCFLEDDLTRDSNAPVEAWMKVLKKDIFQGARNLRIGQFIRTLKPVVKGRLRKCLGVVKKQPKEKRKKVNKQKNQNVDMGDNLNKAKETWQRRNRGKSRTSFFYSPAKEVPVPKPKRKGKDAFEIHKKKNQDHEIPGIGIRNISNTCWLNAAVQGMAALSSFNCKGNDSVSIETQKVLSDLRGYDGGQRKALDTVNLREAIRDNLDNFHIGRQEDSAELIHYFMGENVDNDCHDFTVEITYTKRCLQCNTQSPKTETTTLLNIEVPVRREVSVNDCLDEHCKGEVIRAENAIYCRRCFNQTAHETTAEFANINKGLIILVKRFQQARNGKLTKNTQQLRINRVIGLKDLGVYRLNAALPPHARSANWAIGITFCPASVRRASSTFTLVNILHATICIQTPYITYAMDDNMKLRKCDDTTVEGVKQSTLSSLQVMQSAYVLFYEKMSQKHVKPLLSECNNDVVSKCGGIDLRGHDLNTLLPDQWLNDQVVNAYMGLITSRKKAVCALDVFFFHSLVIGKPNETFFKKAFNCHEVLVPALYNNHWTLMVVNMQAHQIKVFDSSENENPAPGVLLRKFLERHGPQEEKQTYRLSLVNDVPKQRGSSDCGVFACQYAVCVVAKTGITFGTNDAARLRRKMLFELLAEKLL